MAEKEFIKIIPESLPPSMPSAPLEFGDDSNEIQKNKELSEEVIHFDILGLKSLKQILESSKR